MTDDEFKAIALTLDRGFKHEKPFDAVTSGIYKSLLDSYDPVDVMRAVNQMIATGVVWLPVPGEIVTAIKATQTPPTPPWSEVWPILRKAIRKATARGKGGAPPPSHEAVVEWLMEEHHPLIAAFAAAEGLHELGSIPFDDPEYGQLRLAELQRRWQEYVGVAEERMNRDLALASGRREQIGPRHFDPARVLGLRSDELPQIEGPSE